MFGMMGETGRGTKETPHAHSGLESRTGQLESQQRQARHLRRHVSHAQHFCYRKKRARSVNEDR